MHGHVCFHSSGKGKVSNNTWADPLIGWGKMGFSDTPADFGGAYNVPIGVG